MDLPVYAKVFKEPGLGGAHLEVLKLIGRNRRVLDVGCSTGYLAEIIRNELSGIVDGIEVDPGAAKVAAQFTRKVYVGSIEDERLISQLHETYDVLLFLDVLEHLKDPLSALLKTKHLLSKDGYIVASIPNIANWRVRISLLFGKFEYEESGLLDKGHLRFFTLETMKELFQAAGYKMVYLDLTLGEPPSALKGISRPRKNILKALIKKAAQFFPGLFANQFIIKAVKST